MGCARGCHISLGCVAGEHDAHPPMAESPRTKQPKSLKATSWPVREEGERRKQQSQSFLFKKPPQSNWLQGDDLVEFQYPRLERRGESLCVAARKGCARKSGISSRVRIRVKRPFVPHTGVFCPSASGLCKRSAAPENRPRLMSTEVIRHSQESCS